MYCYQKMRLNSGEAISNRWNTHHKEIGPCVGTSWLFVLVHRFLNCVRQIIKTFENKKLAAKVQWACFVINSLENLLLQTSGCKRVEWESMYIIFNLPHIHTEAAGNLHEHLNGWPLKSIFTCSNGLAGVHKFSLNPGARYMATKLQQIHWVWQGRMCNSKCKKLCDVHWEM